MGVKESIIADASIPTRHTTVTKVVTHLFINSPEQHHGHKEVNTLPMSMGSLLHDLIITYIS